MTSLSIERTDPLRPVEGVVLLKVPNGATKTLLVTQSQRNFVFLNISLFVSFALHKVWHDFLISRIFGDVKVRAHAEFELKPQFFL